jgi:hypothetical protein
MKPLYINSVFAIDIERTNADPSTALRFVGDDDSNGHHPEGSVRRN